MEAGVVQGYRQRARMPPSRIPEAQVQAILAELRASGLYSDEAAASEAAPAAPSRAEKGGVGFGAAVIASALMLGLAFSPLPDIVWKRTEAPAAAPPPAPAPQPPQPIEPVLRPLTVDAAPAPIKRAPVTRTATTATPRPKARCLAGGPCGKSDVAAAERRLRTAYNAASRAGVSRAVLASYKSRWDTQKRRAARSPRTTVRSLRAMAVELNRKTAATRARDRRR
jgi:hypothetical protein